MVRKETTVNCATTETNAQRYRQLEKVMYGDLTLRRIEEICVRIDTLQRTGNAGERVRAARAMSAFGHFLDLASAIDKRAA